MVYKTTYTLDNKHTLNTVCYMKCFYVQIQV